MHPCKELRLCTGRTAHRVSRGIALLFLDYGTRRWWGVSVTPRPLFTPGKNTVPIVQEARWFPGPVSSRAENLAHTRIRSRTVQPVASRYTDWATRPTIKQDEFRNISSRPVLMTARPFGRTLLFPLANKLIDNCSEMASPKPAPQRYRLCKPWHFNDVQRKKFLDFWNRDIHYNGHNEKAKFHKIYAWALSHRYSILITV